MKQIKISWAWVTPEIHAIILRRMNGSTFTGYEARFWVSYTAFNKVCDTKEAAQEWIDQVISTMPAIDRIL